MSIIPARASGARRDATGRKRTAAIIFTSGTEGRAKAVVLAHRSLLANQMMLLHVTRRLPYQPDETAGEVCLHTGPLFHIGGIGALLRGVIVGNTLVFPRGRYDPGEALELIERYKISRWNAVPTMATRLLDHPDVTRRDLRSLRTVTLGGAPVHGETVAAGPRGSARRPVAHRHRLWSERKRRSGDGGGRYGCRHAAGSSGRPLPLAEVRIRERPGLPDGEVLVRSPTQMLGYVGVDSPIDAEGWLHTGDLGRLDENGHLWITGAART